MIDLAPLVEQCAPHVAADTMLAIIRTESGGNPYAISYEVRRPDGSRAHLQRQPTTHAEAVAWATWFTANGYSFAAGLAQVYSTNFKVYGLSIENAFRPCPNIAAGAAILTDKYQLALERNGGATGPALVEALSRYNTGHPQRGIANGYVRQVIRKAPAPRRRRRLAAALLALGLATGPAMAREPAPPQFEFSYHVTDTSATGAIRAFDDGVKTVIQFLDLDGVSPVIRDGATGRILPVETIGAYAVLDDVYRHIIVSTDTGTTDILRRGSMPPRPAATGPHIGAHMARPPAIATPLATNAPAPVAAPPAPPAPSVGAARPSREVTGTIALESDPAPEATTPELRNVTGTIELAGPAESTPSVAAPADILATAFAQLSEGLGLPATTQWDRSFVITNGPPIGVFLAASTGALTVIGVRDLANTPIVFVDADTNKPVPFTAIADFAVIARPVQNLVAAVRGQAATIRKTPVAAPSVGVVKIGFAPGSAFLQIADAERLALGQALGRPYSRVLYSAALDPTTVEGAKRMLIVSRKDAIRRYLIRSGVPNDRITEGAWTVPEGQGGEIRILQNP